MKHLLTTLIALLITTCTFAQDEEFISASHAIVELEAEQELLQAYDGVDLKKAPETWEREALFRTLQREAVTDLIEVFHHNPTNKVVLEDYLVNDELVNSKYVSDNMRERLTIYLLGILAVKDDPTE